MIYPDYEKGSIVNLVNSVLKHYNANTFYPVLDDFEIQEHKKLVLIIIDGLGMKFLEEHGKKSYLYSHVKRSLTSVFPSTTASALTTLMTGLSPLQHAMTGWNMYFRELGTVALPLPFKPRFCSESFANLKVNIQDILNFETAIQTENHNLMIVSPQPYINSAFSNYCYGNQHKKGYNNINDFFDIIKNNIFNNKETSIIYSYMADFDETAHDFGINSAESIKLFEQIDQEFANLIEKTQNTDTLFIVTADHGLIDTAPEKILFLKDFPDIEDCLILPLCGEPRVPYCYVRPAKLDKFVKAVNEQLGDFCYRYSQKEIINMKLYGTGEINPKFYDRIGDQILIMKDNYVLFDKIYGEKKPEIIGFHGGLSKDEMIVPLITN